MTTEGDAADEGVRRSRDGIEAQAMLRDLLHQTGGASMVEELEAYRRRPGRPKAPLVSETAPKSFRLPEDIVARLEAYAELVDASQAAVVTHALDRYLPQTSANDGG